MRLPMLPSGAWSWGLSGFGVVWVLLLSSGCSESRELPPDAGGDAATDTGVVDSSPSDVSMDVAIGDGGDADTGVVPSCVGAVAVGEHPVRRLRLDQYRAIYRRLTGVEPVLPPRPDEERLGAASTPYTPLELEALRVAAEDAGPLVQVRLEGLIVGCSSGCYREMIPVLLNETLRRPPTPEETGAFLSLYDRTASDIPTPTGAAFHRVVTAALMSPWFLFTVELGESDDPAEPVWALRPWERMNRLMLAFTEDGLVWGVPPLAFEDADVEAQTALWLSGGFAGIPRFHERWLLTREAVASRADLEASFEAETGAFVSQVYRSEATVDALLHSSYSFLDANAAAAYGVPFSGAVRTRTDLDPATFASLVTHGSWLAGRGIAHRGVALRQALLCGDVPPPPPGICTMLPPEPGETERETYERSLGASPACASCHALFDGFGFALGDFDREGRFVGGADTAGSIAELGAFADATEMAERAAAAEPARRCLAEQWALYLMDQELSTLGRDALRCELEPVIADFVATGDLSTLLARLAVHPALYRRPARPIVSAPGYDPWPPPPRSLSPAGEDLRFAAETATIMSMFFPEEERVVLEQYIETLRDLEARVSP